MPTVAELVAQFLRHTRQNAHGGRCRPNTLRWYLDQLRHLPPALGPVDANEVRPADLAGCPFTWHFRRAVERVWRWGEEAELLEVNRLRRLPKPSPGRRRRVLHRVELYRLLRASPRPLRLLLAFQRHTFARPQELRELRWGDVCEGRRCVVLREFKCRDRRRDGVRVRFLPLDRWACRMLARLRARRRPAPADLVFPNRRGGMFTSNALALGVRRAAARAGLDQRGERATAYTIRHTSATEATRAGMGDRQLADILGHTDTRTTARYQHLAVEDLADQLDQLGVGRRRR